MSPTERFILQDLLDTVDVGLITLDPSGRVTRWNAWMVAASGIEPVSALGHSLSELFSDPKLIRLQQAVDEALTVGASRILTHRLHSGLLSLKTVDGQDLLHDIAVRPVGLMPFDGCLAQITDVTAVVRRERLLRSRQDARYEAVVGSAPDAILTIGADGLVQFANAAAGREFKSPLAGLVGLPIVSCFDDPSAWTLFWEGLLADGLIPHAAELKIRRSDGSTSYVELSAALWGAADDAAVTLILRNVDQRRAADAALRDLNQTLEERVAAALDQRRILADIVENTDALVQVVDTKQRLLAINRAGAAEFSRIYGVQPRIGDNIGSLLATWPEERAAACALWDRALSGEAFTILQPARGAPYAHPAYELKFKFLTDAAGELIGAFRFAYDVTDRLEAEAQLARTEEALRQAQKMEALGQLTGGIAHDFNNLLTGIIGSMDILKRRLIKGKYDDTQRFMDAATASANRAAALTHRLLAFARRQPLAPRVVDVNDLVRSLNELLRRTLGEQITLVTALANGSLHALLDANQFENALLNLVINARDAMTGGGRVTISTTDVAVMMPEARGGDTIEPGDYICVQVADTGSGMTPAVMAKAFDPFFTTKPLGEGTGLGLSMIHGFVKQSRGHVFIETELGSGTAISLYLPRFEGEVTASSTAAPIELAPGQGETVLLVEDDAAVRLLIGEVLSELGYGCIEAANGQVASAILASNTRIDLMISDIGLPGLNGRDLADLARRERPALKILFVTGYADLALRGDEALDPGMELLTKPFALDTLASKIRAML